ncbi:MAG: hypothetical protein EBV48_05170, partial [Betaproteobacteria bacterium]|nr:hypothetical protein [Betaproteobacteria bacterium]
MKSVKLPVSGPHGEAGIRLGRRAFGKTLLASALCSALPAWAKRDDTLFTFESVPLSAQADSVVVPKGYRWRVMAAWGD